MINLSVACDSFIAVTILFGIQLLHNCYSLITSLVPPVSETLKQINFELAAAHSDTWSTDSLPKHLQAAFFAIFCTEYWYCPQAIW
jgi:hypothetical protein